MDTRVLTTSQAAGNDKCAWSSAVRLPAGTVCSPPEPLTLEQFYELVDEDTNAELVGGVIVVNSPASVAHETLLDFLHRLVGIYVEGEDLGQVLGSRSVIRISGHTGREPDLLFLRKDRLHLLQEQEIVGPPDVVVEIISPGDSSREVIAKQAEYEDMGVPECWQIDQRQQCFTMRVRGEDGQFAAADPDEEGRFHSHALPGFWLREEWLWHKPGEFPRTLALLQEIRELEPSSVRQDH